MRLHSDTIGVDINSEQMFRTVEYKARLELLHLIQRAGGNPFIISRPWSRAKSAVLGQKQTDADPFKQLWVNPGEIELRSPKALPIDYGVVESGDWDQDVTRIDETRVYQGLKSWLIGGEEPEDTALYDHFIDQLEARGSYRGYDSYDQFSDRVAELQNLYESIETEGYKTQAKLIEENPNQTIESNNDAIHPYLNEVRVDIARNGKFLWRKGGWHRLSMAKLLEIPEVPVFVVTRHFEWQKKREQFKRRGISKAYRDHPDIEDIRGSE